MKKTRYLVGLIVFAVGLITYGLTVAPTASFWDCGEFISCANELQVPHPPGAPFYLIVGRIFAMFAPSPDKVALFVNFLSVISGALTSLLISWITFFFAARGLGLTAENWDSTPTPQKVVIFFAALVGGLICTFADSVWFNTVEAEVYAPSAFFTALVVWLMCAWWEYADTPRGNRLLILLGFIIGLSIGVHLLNLLSLPALALLYYLRKWPKPTLQGALISIGVGAAVLAFLQYGVILYTFKLAWPFEKFLVGTYDPQTQKTTGLGFPMGSGLAAFTILLIAFLGGAIFYATSRKKPILQTVFLALAFIYLGYSSYAMIYIRSHVNPPIDENDPQSVSNFISYLAREQYGQVPLLYGPMYNARPVGYVEGSPIYLRYPNKDRYVYEGNRVEYDYRSADKRFLPRMWSPNHYTIRAGYPFSYDQFVRNKGADPQDPYDDKPTGLENLRFFFSYQLYHMYIRYFLWNFVGRASEEQDSPAQWGYESSALKSPTYQKEDPSRAHYYGLPLILGLIGAAWQYSKNRKDFAVVAALFFFTGIAIILYLNQPPDQPRERDYSYVGSFITYAIWVGLGVAGLVEWLQPYLGFSTSYVVGTFSLGVPTLMAAQNWKSHSRAGNYMPPDSAYNFLVSCEKNAILFTNGDNDTFPLWYLQEVEGVRTDVRIINLSLLNTDWYIAQFKYQKSNDADPVDVSSPETLYMSDKNAIVPADPASLQYFFQKILGLSNVLVYEKEIAILVPKENLKQAPFIPDSLKPLLVDTLRFKLQTRGGNQNPYLMKQDYMILDIIATNAQKGWKRPIYFANTLPASSYLGLSDYLWMEGMVYHLIPARYPSENSVYNSPIHVDKTLRLLQEVYRYRNLDNPNVFYDSNTRRMIANYRNVAYRTAEYLARLAEKDSTQAFYRQKAIALLDFMKEKVSPYAAPLEPYQMASEAQIRYFSLKDTSGAKFYTRLLEKRLEADYAYYCKTLNQRLPDEDGWALQALFRIHYAAQDTNALHRINTYMACLRDMGP
ncbi:MAG: glycosyltransferase family 117 protein [Bacteroidia bacterium]